MAINRDGERAGEALRAIAGRVGHGVGERRAVVVQRVDRGIGVVERVGVSAVGVDFECAELAGDVGSDAGGLAVDGGHCFGAAGAGVVGQHVAGDGVGGGVFGDGGGIGRDDKIGVAVDGDVQRGI